MLIPKGTRQDVSFYSPFKIRIRKLETKKPALLSLAAGLSREFLLMSQGFASTIRCGCLSQKTCWVQESCVWAKSQRCVGLVAIGGKKPVKIDNENVQKCREFRHSKPVLNSKNPYHDRRIEGFFSVKNSDIWFSKSRDRCLNRRCYVTFSWFANCKEFQHLVGSYFVPYLSLSDVFRHFGQSAKKGIQW